MNGAVGFLGLGTMGAPMARRLLAWPHGLHVYDVAAGPVADLAAAGAQAAASPAELAGTVGADGLVCVMVRDDAQVRAVLGELADAAGDGLIVVLHSTVAPGTPADLAARYPRLRLLDAPVSGGARGAAAGTLALMVGGPVETFTQAADVLALLGSRVVHAGPIGAGTAMKLARNLLHFTAFTAATEAQRLAEAAGIDLVALGTVVRHSDAVTGGPGAIMHRSTTAALAPDDPWYGLFAPAAALGEKDLGFALELGEALGVDLPLARLARQRLRPGLGVGGPPNEETTHG